MMQQQNDWLHLTRVFSMQENTTTLAKLSFFIGRKDDQKSQDLAPGGDSDQQERPTYEHTV